MSTAKGLIPTGVYEVIQAVEQCRITNKTFVEVQCKPLDCCDDLCEKKTTIAVADGQNLKYALGCLLLSLVSAIIPEAT